MFKKNQDTFDNRNAVEDDGFSDFFDEPLAEDTEPEQEQMENGFDSSEITEEPSEPVKKKKEKKQKKNKKATNQESEEPEEVAPKQDMILYIIVDKPVVGLINYFRESGVKVSNIFSDITDAKNAVLMQSEPTRIVVIDTGLGKFTTTTMRAELIDMLGISDEHNKTTVFYTDSVLKVDTNRALGKSGKNIDWVPYKSTAIVAAAILSYRENYIYDSADEDDKLESAKALLNFKGLTLANSNNPRMNITGFSSDSILTHVVNSEEGLIEGFEVAL